MASGSVGNQNKRDLRARKGLVVTVREGVGKLCELKRCGSLLRGPATMEGAR